MTKYDIAMMAAVIAIITAAIFVAGPFEDTPPPPDEPYAMSPALQSAIAQDQAERISEVRGDGFPMWNKCVLFEQGRRNCVPTIIVDDGGVTYGPVLPCEIKIKRYCKENYGWTP